MSDFQLPEYHVMVLLVDDQALVCEAIRRCLANQPTLIFIIAPTRTKPSPSPINLNPPSSCRTW